MQPASPWIPALFVMTLALPGLACADELTPEKRADIRQLVGVSGAKLPTHLAEATAQNTARLLRDARPDIPDRFYVVLRRELTALFEERMDAPGGLVERLTAIYDRQLTHPEVKALLAFYQTPLGQKSLALVPTLIDEGASWAQTLAPDIRKRLQAALGKEGMELPRKQ
jgi:hypothetical protein